MTLPETVADATSWSVNRPDTLHVKCPVHASRPPTPRETPVTRPENAPERTFKVCRAGTNDIHSSSIPPPAQRPSNPSLNANRSRAPTTIDIFCGRGNAIEPDTDSPASGWTPGASARNAAAIASTIAP